MLDIHVGFSITTNWDTHMSKCHYCEKDSVEHVDVPQKDGTNFRVHFCKEHFDVFAKKARNFAQMNEWMAKLGGVN
jgi:hypothetical protein